MDWLNKTKQLLGSIPQQVYQFGQNLVGQVESLPQQVQATGQLLNQGLQDQSVLPKPVNNYLYGVGQEFARTPAQFNPAQFQPQNLINSTNNTVNSINQKIFGFGPNGEAPSLPPMLGGGFDTLAESAINPIADQALLRGGALLQNLKTELPEFNNVLGQAGKLSLGIKSNPENLLEEPFQGIRTTSTLEDISRPIDKNSGVRFINGTPPGGTKILNGLIENSGAPQDFIQSLEQNIQPNPVSGQEGFQPFADWVNARHALGAEKQIVQNKFGDLASQGMEPFFQIQAGESRPQLYRGVGPSGSTQGYSQLGKGIYLSSDRNVAEFYAKNGGTIENHSILPTAKMISADSPEFKKLYTELANQGKLADLADILKQRGYDGAVGTISGEGGPKYNQTVIYNPDVLKKAEDINPRLNDVRQYLDQKYQVAKKAGLNFNYQQDYLPQMWQDPPEKVAQVFGGALTNKPGFTVEKIIQDYKTGIEAGLTPKYNNIPELLADYEGKVNKAVADRNFTNALTKNNLLLPQEGAPADWQTLNPDRFPRIKYNNGAGIEGFQEGPFKAPKDLADKINNYLYRPSEGNGFQRGLNAAANYTSRLKNIALSFGIPNTGINAHGFNILARHTLAGTGGNPLTRLGVGLKELVHQGSFALEDAPAAIHAGLTLGTEDHQVLNEGSLKSMFGDKWNSMFEKPLFDRMIPNLKLSSWKALTADYVKKGLPEDQAGQQAAKLVNNVYGGINWEQIGRSRDFQNILRLGILAPDWAESNLKLGGNIAKSLVGKGGVTGGRYASMAATLAGTYVVANIANKLNSGHYMWENEPGHEFDIEAGYTSNGQKRYVRPYGTAVDFLRVPVEVAMQASHGDLSGLASTVRNRLSIPAGVGVGMLTDTDYRGKPIGYKGKDQFGNEMPALQRAGSIGSELGSLVGFPSFLKQGIDYGTGKTGGEQAALQALEIPVRYTGGAYSKSQQAVEGVGKAEGMTGKDLYDLNKKTQGLTLSPNQQQMIKAGGTNELNNIMQLKDARSKLNQLKDQLTGKKQASNDGTTQAFASDFPQESLVSANSLVPTTQNAPSVTQVTPQMKILASIAKQKAALNQPLSPQEQQALAATQEPQLKSAQYELDAQRAKSAGDVTTYLQKTQDYINYLGKYEQSLNPQTDMPEIIKTQNKIEDLTATKDKTLSQGGFKKGRKIKASSVLSRFKLQTKPVKPLTLKGPSQHAINLKSPHIRTSVPQFSLSNLKSNRTKSSGLKLIYK